MKKKPVQFRTRVNCGRVSGKVAHWQAEKDEGWIRPDTPIDHVYRAKNSGLLLVKRKDVSAGQALKPGQAVDFLVYSEVTEGGRLGAEFCRSVPGKSPNLQNKAPTVTRPAAKPKPAAKPLTQPKKVLQTHLKIPQDKPKLLTPVPKKGGKPPPVVAPPGKGFKASIPTTLSAPSSEGFRVKTKLPRQPVGTVEQTGQLREWWGKYGWIIPDKPVQHPLAGKRQGKLYVHLSDMEDDSVTVNPGSRVSFLVYAWSLAGDITLHPFLEAC